MNSTGDQREDSIVARTKRDSDRPSKTVPASKARRIFWAVMIFFCISGVAYFFDQLVH